MSAPQQPAQKPISNRLLLSVFLFFTTLTITDAGVALRLYYRDIDGSTISSLTNHSTFPDLPAAAEPVMKELAKDSESFDQFGTWTRGYVEAPQTGNYIFMLASDDHGEFWLSSSSDPAGKKNIAVNDKWVGPADYAVKPAQRSSSIPLVKGEKYYFELLHKDLQGRDHVSVAWQWPDGTVEAPLSARWLLPFPVDKTYRAIEKAPTLLQEYFGKPVTTLKNVTVGVGESVSFEVTVEATPPFTLQWFRNQQPIPGANSSVYIFPKASLENDVDIFSVVASNRLGQASASAVLSVIVDDIPPAMVSVTSQSDLTSLEVLFSKKIDPRSASNPQNYLVDGVAAQKAKVSEDRTSVRLTVRPLASEATHHLRVQNVQDTAQPPNTMAPSSLAVQLATKIWLTFDEPNATNAIDVSGHGHHAILYNDPEPVAEGKIGGCLSFNGDGQYGLLPDADYDFSHGMTIALWVKPTTMKTWARLIDFGNGPGMDCIVLARRSNSDDLYLQIYDGKNSKGQVTATGAITLNQWQHFVVTIEEDGRAVIYKDGVALKTGTTLVPKKISRTNHYIGRSNWQNDKFFAGLMDDLRIYERPLNLAEIKALAEEMPNPHR